MTTPHTKITQTIKKYAQTHNVPIMDDPTRIYLEKLLIQKQPEHVLEIGSAIAWSTLHIANSLKQRGGELISCEISHPSYMLALYNLHQHNITNTILYHGDFLKLPAAVYPQSFDFVFIDAQKSDYLDYRLHLQPLCHESTTYIFDDVIKFTHKVSPFLQHLDECKISYNIIETIQDDGILIIGAQQ